MVDVFESEKTSVILDGDEALECARPKARELTPRQRLWVNAYIANGRNARQASIAAGTSPVSAAEMGHRNIRNPVILEAIRHAAGDSIKARLPELIEAMVELVLDPKVSAVARVSAFRELADRAGMAVQRGPMVTINNGLTDPKAQAQALIAEIWTEKNTREARRERTEAYVGELVDAKKSGVDGAISDIIDNDAPFAALGSQAHGTGGGASSGAPRVPVADTSPLRRPPDISANERSVAAWREAVRLASLGACDDWR